MSEPGWYPDPQDDAQKRFWNGAEWTEQVRAEDREARPVLLPSTSARRSNTVLWSVLVLVLCLLVGSGWWLSTNVNQSSSAPNPESSPGEQTPSAAIESASSAESVSSSATDPATPSAASTTQAPLGDGRPRSEAEIAADPASTENPAGLKVGDTIDAVPGCPGNATGSESIGEIGKDGRLTSKAGLSIPAIDGFDPQSDDGASEKFIYQSNTLSKKYPNIIVEDDNPLVASVTLGTLKAEEGFTEVIPSAQRVAACIAGNSGIAARIDDIRYMPDSKAVWLNVEIDFPPGAIPSVQKNYISVFTCLHDGVMHVALADLPDVTVQETETYDALWNAVKDMRLPS